MPEIPITFPFGGLNDDQAASAQPANTSRELVNVRGIDPETGRQRGGVRGGHTKRISSAAPGGLPVRLLDHTTVNRSGSTYAESAQGAEQTKFFAQSPQASFTARAVKIDQQRNVYIVDGDRGVAKFNSTGGLVWKFIIAISAVGQIIRALEIDIETGAIYLGVSAGGDQAEAKIYKYLPNDEGEGEPNPEWTVTPGAFIEKLVVRRGVLYAALNFPDVGASSIRAYRLIDTAVPEIAWEREQVPYPINDMDVRKRDGAVFTAHPANATRAYHLASPDTQRVAVDAEPEDFVTDYETYAWAKLDASDIDGDGSLNEEYDTGDEIILWLDGTGNGRNAYDPATVYGTNPATWVAPVLIKDKFYGGNDALVFGATSTTYNGTHSGLVSGINANIQANASFSQRTLIPAYTSATYTVVCVARGTSSATSAQAVWAQDDSASGEPGRALMMNAAGATATAVTPSAGALMMHDRSSPTFGTVAPTIFDSLNGFSISVVTVSATSTILYSNGSPTGAPNATSLTTATEATQLGRYTAVPNDSTTALTGAGPFSGSIAYFHSFNKVLSSAERIAYEGYLAWRFGIAHKLAIGHAHTSAPPTTSENNSDYWGSESPYSDLTSAGAMLVKWSPDGGNPLWSINDAAGAAAGSAIGGLGYGVAADASDGTPYVWSMGTSSATTPGAWTQAQILKAQSVVRQIIDTGDDREFDGSFVANWQSRWGTSASFRVPTYQYPRMAVAGRAPNEPDEFCTSGPFARSFVYVPYYTGDPATFAASSTAFIYHNAPGVAVAGTSLSFDPVRTVMVPTSERAFAVATPPFRTEYTPGQVSYLMDEHIALGVDAMSGGTSIAAYMQLVDEQRGNVPPRYPYTLAGTSTELYRADTDWTSVGGTYGAITSTGYVMSTQLYSQFYITDGRNYRTFDPRMAGTSQGGAIREWKPKGSGEIPPKCRLITTWRSRIVLARAHEDPTNWYMSEIGNPLGWNFFPAVPNSGQAVAGSTQLAGRSLGVVNAIIPFSDDLLYIGCDQGILRLTGDPASDGQIDLVTDSIGMSFGEPWCRDPEGRLYFFSSRGGVYVSVPGAPIASLSDASIRRRLQDIDLSIYHIRLVWDWRADGLHVYLCPFTQTETVPPSYFWERKSGAWFQDELPFIVYSARLADGDGPDDRVVMLGTSAGLIVEVDENADTDNGTGIFSRATIGPLTPGSSDKQFIFKNPRIALASDLNGCEIAMLASDVADVPGTDLTWAYIGQGSNDKVPMRARGAFVWFKLRSLDTTGRWAFENGQIGAEPAGMRRRIS